MTRTDELETALRTDWSDEALSVYADHLQAIGDPRGELIALDLEGADGEPAVARRGELVRKWLRADGFLEVWWEPNERRWYAGNKAQGTWILPEFGLLEVVHDGDATETPSALLNFLVTPASQYIHRVSIAAGTRGLRDAIRVMTSRDRPWVRALALARQDGARDLVFRDTSSFGATLPNLTQVAVTGRYVLDDLDHAGVTELVVTGEAAIRLTGSPPLASVTTLDFAFESGTVRAGLHGRLDRDRLPRLKRLVLSRQEPNRPIDLERLADLDVADQLGYLELPSLRSLADVSAVERAADRMQSLRELAIARAYMCFGDCRVELARARVRSPAPFPWRPLDELEDTRLHVGDDSAPTEQLISALEAVYDQLPIEIRSTWFRIWTSLATARRCSLDTHQVREALEALPLGDETWQRAIRRLQWHGPRVEISFDGL